MASMRPRPSACYRLITALVGALSLRSSRALQLCKVKDDLAHILVDAVVSSTSSLVWSDLNNACNYYCGSGSGSVTSSIKATFCEKNCACHDPRTQDGSMVSRYLTANEGSEGLLLAKCGDAVVQLGEEPASAFAGAEQLTAQKKSVLAHCATGDCIKSSCFLGQLKGPSVGVRTTGGDRPQSFTALAKQPASYLVKVKENSNSVDFQFWLAKEVGGVGALHYVPETSFVFEVVLSDEQKQAIAAREEVDYVTEKPDVYKLSDATLRSLGDSSWKGMLEIRLNSAVKDDAGLVQKQLNSLLENNIGMQNLVQISSSGKKLYIDTAEVENPLYLQSALAELSSLGFVKGVQPAIRAFKLRAVSSVEYVKEPQELDIPSRRRRLDGNASLAMGLDMAYAKNLTGSGVVIGIADTGLYFLHDQFIPSPGGEVPRERVDKSARKIVQYVTASGNYIDEAEGNGICGHGTHVSGIALGNGLKFNNRSGMAYNAKLSFMDVGLLRSPRVVTLAAPEDMQALFGPHVKAGAKIISFSWGGASPVYNQFSADMDEYLYRNPNLLVLIAAGNDGDGTLEPADPENPLRPNCKGGLIGSPADGKNLLAIGASINRQQSFGSRGCPGVNENGLAFFSSRGPAPDGRRKPEIACPGYAIVSAMSQALGPRPQETAAVCELVGTSMACPACAGFAAILEEWLATGRYAENGRPLRDVPSSLMRGFLLFSTIPLKAWYPRLPTSGSCSNIESNTKSTTQGDNFQGFGRVNMANLMKPKEGTALFFLPNATMTPKIADGATQKYLMAGYPSGVGFRVVITWTDPPSSAVGSCDKVLVNDIDLRVEEVDANQAVLQTFTPVGAINGRDSVNNHEMVDIPPTSPGRLRLFQVVVKGASIKVGGQQEYSIVCSATAGAEGPQMTSFDESGPSRWKLWMIILASVSIAVVLGILCFLGYKHRMRSHIPKSAQPPAPYQSSDV